MTTVRTLMTLVLCSSLAGCSGALWGNLVVLAVTVGIFFGTLSLGRSSEATRSTKPGSSPTRSQS
ncbi:MAG: hypothetical protein ACOC9T_03180 [Myxococcota bacterium]